MKYRVPFVTSEHTIFGLIIEPSKRYFSEVEMFIRKEAIFYYRGHSSKVLCSLKKERKTEVVNVQVKVNFRTLKRKSGIIPTLDA